MNTKYSKDYATKFLDQLIDLDKTTNAAYYEMGRLLSAISKNTLWDLMGYSSFGHMVEEELSFAPGTAHHYITLYDNLRRLKYNKAESLKLLHEHSMTRLLDVLPPINAKLSSRALGKRIADLDTKQLNFMITSKELVEANRALDKLGATMTKTGRRQHASEAFMGMVREVNKRPAVKAVA
jgi:hypothetical protein